ncbi:beta-lactamase-like protein [Gilbertella persicaria]|uniref:beta-lactamase-like protein n=1 Tax=Gilbertella persicaria TaxID=101096 RepID=UPI002220FE8B|nr:beta-lactamase-like protein [Gilbertella persicaria]KAI8060651.1 beta-lactamase-like protein [Gilbertella persicaria]
MTEVLAHLPQLSQLSRRVWRVLGLNPGKFTLQGTNTYLLGAGPKKILLDCGEGKSEYVKLLESSLQETHPEAYISDIIISHGHADHWGGLEDILNSKTLNRDIQVHKFPLPQGNHIDHMEKFPKHLQVKSLYDNQVFHADDTTLKVIYTPGHTADHCTFWLEEEKSVFTADCVLGQGTAVFEDLTSYLAGLQKLVDLNPDKLYPGHGPVIEQGVSKLKEYISHRLERERQVLDLIKTRHEGLTPLEIVQVLYKNYPESLHIPAARGIVLHLQKLKQDGQVMPSQEHAFTSDNYPKILNITWTWVQPRNNL